MKYQQSKVKVIEAQQFLNKDTHGVFDFWYDGTIDKITGKVKTLQGEEVEVKQGEWIVKEPQQLTEKLGEDRYYPIADEYFKENYMPYQDERYYFVSYEYMVSMVDGKSEQFFGSCFVACEVLSFKDFSEMITKYFMEQYKIHVLRVGIESFREVSKDLYDENSNYNHHDHIG